MKIPEGPDSVAAHRPDPAAPKQSLREVQKQLTRERLIVAAAEEFRARGYNETTAENIATAAGASRATFYVYFRAKSEIVAELMLRSQGDVLKAYRQLDALVSPTLPDVTAWLEDTMTLWRESAADFITMEQALANDELVTETWMSTLENTYQVMPRVFSRYPSPAQHERARLHLLTLQMSMDRTMFFTVLRARPVNMTVLKEVLAHQWLAFLAEPGADADTVGSAAV